MVSCPRCGMQFEKRPNKKFCSSACRIASHRAPKTDKPDDSGSVYDATKAELDRAGVAASALGRMALGLAMRLDAGGESGSSAAQVNRELRATLEQATKGNTTAVDPVDELQKRREARRVARGG